MAKQLTTDSRPTHEEIAARARQLYEQSGHQAGRDLDNWLQAEAQLMAARKRHHDRPQHPQTHSPAQPVNQGMVKMAGRS